MQRTFAAARDVDDIGPADFVTCFSVIQKIRMVNAPDEAFFAVVACMTSGDGYSNDPSFRATHPDGAAHR